jgi:hypothetical protein
MSYTLLRQLVSIQFGHIQAISIKLVKVLDTTTLNGTIN